jgi:hypothetical protein
MKSKRNGIYYGCIGLEAQVGICQARCTVHLMSYSHVAISYIGCLGMKCLCYTQRFVDKRKEINILVNKKARFV